jgi:hypothetical protein
MCVGIKVVIFTGAVFRSVSRLFRMDGLRLFGNGNGSCRWRCNVGITGTRHRHRFKLDGGHDGSVVVVRVGGSFLDGGQRRHKGLGYCQGTLRDCPCSVTGVGTVGEGR